jgi:hypothetical protein
MYQETQYGRGLLSFLAAADVAATASSTPAQKAAAANIASAISRPTVAPATSTAPPVVASAPITATAAPATAAAPSTSSAASIEQQTETAALNSVSATSSSCYAGAMPTGGQAISSHCQQLLQAIQQRYLPAYTTATGASNANACAGIGSGPNADQLTATIGKAATSTAAGVTGSLVATGAIAAGSALAVAVPVIGTVIGLITTIVGIIGAHHAQAVATQDELLCQLVPAVNNAWQTIDAGLAAGSITPAQASSSYSSLQTQFTSGVQSDPSYKPVDALYAYNRMVIAITSARNSDLSNGLLTGGAPGPWTAAGGSGSSAAPGSIEATVDSAISSLTSSSTLPWLLAAGAALLFLL